MRLPSYNDTHPRDAAARGLCSRIDGWMENREEETVAQALEEVRHVENVSFDFAAQFGKFVFRHEVGLQWALPQGLTSLSLSTFRHVSAIRPFSNALP